MIITVNEYPEVTSMVNNDNKKQFWSTFCDYRKLRRTKQYMLNISTIVSKSFLKVWLFPCLQLSLKTENEFIGKIVLELFQRHLI